MRHTLLIAGIVSIVLSAMSGCVSRTLPLPPPEVARVSSPNAQGLVTLEGYCSEGASVGVVNNRTFDGVIVTSPERNCDELCPWTATLPGREGDSFRVWQFYETEGAHEAQVPPTSASDEDAGS